MRSTEFPSTARTNSRRRSHGRMRALRISIDFAVATFRARARVHENCNLYRSTREQALVRKPWRDERGGRFGTEILEKNK
jgi:hypothetical protein